MAEIGTGASISFDSGFFAEILSISPPSGTRKAIDTSHMGTTTAMTFTPGDLVDWGSIEVEIAFDPGVRPPIDDAAETCTITFADSGAATISCTAFMTDFKSSVPLEDRMTASCTLKVTGDVTFTA